MKQAPKKKAKRKISLYKKDLWKQFALWVKLSKSPDGRYCPCFTCDAPLEIGTSNCQAGHWLPQGGYSATVFEPDNVRPQCYRCNIRLSGNTAVFEHRLRLEIGNERVDELFEKRNNRWKADQFWYSAKTNEYKTANDRLREDAWLQ